MTFTELDALRNLSRKEMTSIRDLCSVVDLYKYGIRSNPWESLSMKSLKHAKQDLEQRVDAR